MKINKTTIIVITLTAFFIQLLIINYNYITGYIQIPNFLNLLLRICIGTSFTTVFGLILVSIDLIIIKLMDKFFFIPQRLVPRIPIQFILTIIAGIFIGTSVTFVANLIMPYEDGLSKNIINNSLIVCVINVIIILTIEAIIWFKRNQENKLIAAKLEQENEHIKLQILKEQLNPHFLFNSLNALSSLTLTDPVKAQSFVEEFAIIYRYTLDVIDKHVVELREEVDFIKSFLFLQKIRFEDSIEFEIEILANKLEKYVPPLALQTLLENIFKHNRASKESPLLINIYDENNYIIVKNNLQLKQTNGKYKKVGLENLKKRYGYLSGNNPEFSITKDNFIAKIPLIDIED